MKKTITIFILALMIVPVITVTATENGVMNSEEQTISEFGRPLSYSLETDDENDIPVVGNKNQAPNKPVIAGPITGTIGQSYSYKISTLDPQGDNVYYKISWGDCSVIYWAGPYESGEEITFDHAWCNVCFPGGGDFTIQVWVKDDNDNTGPSETLEITMSGNGITPQSSIRSSFVIILEVLMERFPLLDNLLDF